jgi:hypothetical protein
MSKELTIGQRIAVDLDEMFEQRLWEIQCAVNGEDFSKHARKALECRQRLGVSIDAALRQIIKETR